MNAAPDLHDVLQAFLADRLTSWSIGGYGAIAEFHWLDDDRERVRDFESLTVATDRGALHITLGDEAVPHAYQLMSAHPDRWLHGVSLCLPWRRARLSRRRELTELGRDSHAIREEDRDAVLFDLGLGLPHVDVCVRSRSPELLAILRANCGDSLLASGNSAMPAIRDGSPHRVFISRLGRLEVYQRVGSAHEDPPTPEGPHTHLLPRLLNEGHRPSHGGSAPAHHYPCANLYPAHPLLGALGERKAFDPVQHARFAELLDRWGDEHFLAEKRRAVDAIRQGLDPQRYSPPADRRGRAALRIAIRELAQLEGESEMLARWRNRFDRTRKPTHPDLVH